MQTQIKLELFETTMSVAFPRITQQGKTALMNVVLGLSTVTEAAKLFKVSRQPIEKNLKRYKEKSEAVLKVREMFNADTND